MKVSLIHRWVYLLFGFACFVSCIGHHKEIKVMTYNIRLDTQRDSSNRWNLRKSSMVDLINKYKPIIIGIQEGLPHQVSYLDSALVNYSYIGVGRDNGIAEGEFSAIFFDSTQIKVKEYSTFWLSEYPDSASFGWDAACRRICTYGLFENTNTNEIFWVFNTHFDHVGVVAREKSAELIISKIRMLNRNNLPVILMGDFNSTGNSPPILIIEKELTDSYNLSENFHVGPSGTFNGFDTNRSVDERIDFIFVSGFKVLSHTHLNDKRDDGLFISDHLPVMVTLKFNQQ